MKRSYLFKRLDYISLLMLVPTFLHAIGCNKKIEAPTGCPTGRIYRNILGMSFIEITPGSFMMGSEEARDTEKPAHRVKIRNAIYVQQTEVTQAQWVALMGDNPSEFIQPKMLNPVESVSWDDCQIFIKKLNELDPGKGYRLPTEAEWEFFCRAGTSDSFYGELDEIAWYAGNSNGKTHPVAQKRPNAWGLYDMIGNVYEWCRDEYYPSYSGAPSDGSARNDNLGTRDIRQVVFRGGSFLANKETACAYRRSYAHQSVSSRLIGFRLVLCTKPASHP